ncbi:hypothetical protein A7985_16815 [Pseudoalteromonas luteoviolacea]|uniref:Uncharacterized protein n=1 Tax=Pseudoalteromonas luteoviolacea TaxID=43657 RepID=A0A1C0TMU0_9GAMM|nr:hypothetical protein A7985_16815 [Pseudoalteromonas luteoviolacea]
MKKRHQNSSHKEPKYLFLVVLKVCIYAGDSMNLTPNNLELNIFLQKNKMLNSGQFVKKITQKNRGT